MRCWSWRPKYSMYDGNVPQFHVWHLHVRTTVCRQKSSLSSVGFSIIDITNVCVLTCTTDDNNFCCAVLSFPHRLFFAFPFFLVFCELLQCFQCVPFHGGARIFYLYVKSDRKEVYHAAAKHTATQMIEWETECNQFFFTLRLLFSLKERTCALSLHCICACMLLFFSLSLLAE